MRNKMSYTPDDDDDSYSGWETIKRVTPYLWPKNRFWLRVRVVLAMIALVLAKVATALTPLFFIAAIDALTPEEASGSVAWLMGMSAVGLVIGYGLMRLATVGFNQLRDALFARVAQRALRVLARETFDHIHALSLRYHLQRKTGGLSRIIERGVKGVEFLLRFMLFSIGPLILELIFVGIALVWLFDIRYLGVVAVTIFFYVIFTFKVTEWRVNIRRQQNKADTEANQKAIDSLLNFETVKYFSAEERESARYDVSMRAYQQAAIKTSYSLGFLNFGQSIMITTGLVIVMIMAAIGVENGDLTVGEFVGVNTYMIQLVMPLNFLGSVYREIRQALVDMGQMFSLLGQPPEITDKPDAPALEISGGEVSFENVDFSYEENRQILHKLNLRVGPGETIAVVGPSGSGKSTIGRLLFRFYDVSQGALRIDGQDVRDMTQKSLRAKIGVVPQDTVLFNDTVGYNIAYGREGASQKEVESAAKAAQIHDFIVSLPEGYNTQVGERGLKLSGGEKQRVGIARTLLKNPPILLLDEATSALDTETEQGILESLRAMGHGRSVITIAHRLSTVVDADKIVVLEKGHVVEEGTHADLLEKNGRYAAMWQRQRADMAEA
ncbi:MAG: ATP-binding cassette domain-containing protein [Rhodobacteraceae bacterium]|nr:ATP-binding cassette domain-containing protein [Paracoccaceae bacterium]